MGTFSETTLPKISYFYPKTRIIISLVALVFASQILPEIISNILAVAVVVSIGLMHGATDHILYINSEDAEFTSKIPKSFIIKYLFILAGMGAIWLIIPELALISFLIISAYHFGQTQLQYIPVSESSWSKKLLYTTWGVLILALIVLLNLEESKGLIISAIPSLDLSILSDDTSQLIILSSLILTIVVFIGLHKKLNWRLVAFEILEVLVIAYFSLQTNLLVSFGLFFGLWHSLRASQVQIDKVSLKQEFNAKLFIRESLPFTLISIFGISLMLLGTYYFGSQIRAEMLFLVAISMLTLPHMFIYERFYNYFDTLSAKQN